jgi:hypothetical protein
MGEPVIRAFKRFVSSLLIVCLASLSLPVHAGMLPTDADRAQIFTWLDREEVRTQLQVHGVTPMQVKARVAAMTDDEAAQLAADIDSLPAGGADILGVALAVFIILLITDILGFTKIFPFTHSIRK